MPTVAKADPCDKAGEGTFAKYFGEAEIVPLVQMHEDSP